MDKNVTYKGARRPPANVGHELNPKEEIGAGIEKQLPHLMPLELAVADALLVDAQPLNGVDLFGGREERRRPLRVGHHEEEDNGHEHGQRARQHVEKPPRDEDASLGAPVNRVGNGRADDAGEPGTRVPDAKPLGLLVALVPHAGDDDKGGCDAGLEQAEPRV